MLLLIEKLLLFSMRLEQSRRKGIRLLGKLLGNLAAGYTKWLEKRLFAGTWDPARRWRKRGRGKNARNAKKKKR